MPGRASLGLKVEIVVLYAEFMPCLWSSLVNMVITRVDRSTKSIDLDPVNFGDDRTTLHNTLLATHAPS